MWIKIIGMLVVLVGLIFVFDSRRIAKLKFSFGDENTTTLGMKLFGAIVSLLGCVLFLL